MGHAEAVPSLTQPNEALQGPVAAEQFNEAGTPLFDETQAQWPAIQQEQAEQAERGRQQDEALAEDQRRTDAGYLTGAQRKFHEQVRDAKTGYELPKELPGRLKATGVHGGGSRAAEAQLTAFKADSQKALERDAAARERDNKRALARELTHEGLPAYNRAYAEAKLKHDSHVEEQVEAAMAKSRIPADNIGARAMLKHGLRKRFTDEAEKAARAEALKAGYEAAGEWETFLNEHGGMGNVHEARRQYAEHKRETARSKEVAAFQERMGIKTKEQRAAEAAREQSQRDQERAQEPTLYRPNSVSAAEWLRLPASGKKAAMEAAYARGESPMLDAFRREHGLEPIVPTPATPAAPNNAPTPRSAGGYEPGSDPTNPVRWNFGGGLPTSEGRRSPEANPSGERRPAPEPSPRPEPPRVAPEPDRRPVRTELPNPRVEARASNPAFNEPDPLEGHRYEPFVQGWGPKSLLERTKRAPHFFTDYFKGRREGVPSTMSEFGPFEGGPLSIRGVLNEARIASLAKLHIIRDPSDERSPYHPKYLRRQNWRAAHQRPPQQPAEVPVDTDDFSDTWLTSDEGPTASAEPSTPVRRPARPVAPAASQAPVKRPARPGSRPPVVSSGVPRIPDRDLLDDLLGPRS